jgi:hypothetical protein
MLRRDATHGACYVAVMDDENVPNLIPSVALVAGAGGVAVDFAGRLLRDRTLAVGRTSVLPAANDEVRRRVLGLVATAHARAGVSR